MIEETLTALLKTKCPRTYPLVAPSGTAQPFITYTRVSTARMRDLSGPAGLSTPTFRVDCYAIGYLVAKQLANSVRLLLDGYRAGDITSIECVQERDLSDLTSNPALTRIQLEFAIQHRE